MERRPARPARFRRPQYIVAALIAALIVVVCVTGFVWAQKAVTVVVDGQSRPLKTQSGTVAAVLAETGVTVGEGDVVTPAPETLLEDGMTVVVLHATHVNLALQGGDVDVAVVGDTVADALVAAGLDPSCGIATEPSLDTPLSEGMTVTVSDVFVRVVEEAVEIPFDTVSDDDGSASFGTRTVVTKGEPGKLLRVYRVLVTNGVEGPRTLIAEEVVREPVSEVVAVGTKRSSGYTVASRSATAKTASSANKTVAKAPTSGETMRVSTTAYAPGVGGVGTRTATGAKAGFGIAAVDPKVIPLGTRIYVPGYGYAVAADTGGAIHGNRVDLCFDTAADAYAWGRRTVTITIVD